MTNTQTAAKWTAELVRARVSDPAGAEPIANVLNRADALAAEKAKLREALAELLEADLRFNNTGLEQREYCGYGDWQDAQSIARAALGVTK